MSLNYVIDLSSPIGSCALQPPHGYLGEEQPRVAWPNPSLCGGMAATFQVSKSAPAEGALRDGGEAS